MASASEQNVTVDMSAPSSSTNGKTEKHPRRKMDFMESITCAIPGTDSNVAMPFVIDSQAPLTEILVRKAAILLARRHPLLRSKIIRERTADSRKDSLSFGEIEEKDVVDVRCVDEIDWAEAQIVDGTVMYDFENGPLWRIWLLQSVEIPPEDREFSHPYRTSLVLGMHHGIMDANSGMRVIDDFLTFLEMVQSSPDELPKVESLPLIPGMYNLLPPESLNMPWYKFYKLVGKGFRGMTQSSTNMYIKYHKDEIESRAELKREARIHPMVLDRSLTSQIITNSKKNGITVNSTLTAAAAVSAAKFILGDNFNPGKKYTMPCFFAVDMRRFLPEDPGKEHVSGFFGNVEYRPKVSAVSTQEEFWKMAKAYHADLHKLIYIETLEMIKIFNFVLKLGVDPVKMVIKAMEKSPYGLMKSAFNMSNMGRCDFVARKGGRPFELSGVYMVVALNVASPLLVNNIFTFHGKMFWSLVYCNRIMSKERAKEYADILEDTLKFACGEDT